MTEPRSFSFVVPAYGDSPYLEQTLESLQRQEHRCPVLIRWVRRPASRHFLASDGIQLIESDQAQGIGGDWEAALRSAQTTWTTIAHADDLYDPRYSAAVLRAALQFPQAGVIFTGASYESMGLSHRLLAWFKARINPATRWNWFASEGATPRLIPAARMARALKWGSFVACPTVAYRSSLLRDEKLFSTELKTALDWKAWLDLAERGIDFIYIPAKLVTLRVHPEATTQHTLRSGVRSQEELAILSRLWSPLMVGLVRRLLIIGQWLQRLPTRSGSRAERR
jgi:hypothetical protein